MVPPLSEKAYQEIRRVDYAFGQQIAQLYRELPEAERAAAFMEIVKPYCEAARQLYGELFGIEDAVRNPAT